MNVNTETRETARVSNALDALKAARSAMRLADKKASDALSVVERHCPRDRGNKCGYDTWHPTYQTYKRALAELKDSQRNYYVEYLTTARGAVMSKVSKPHSLIPTEHSIFTNTCVCEYFMFADSNAATLGRLIIWKDTNGLILRSLTAGSYQLDTCSTDALTVAAERWRGIIDSTDVDAPEHREARYAHTAIASTLFAYRGTIATGDLAALMDMFNEQEQAREAGKDARTLTLTFCDPRYPYESVNSVETLIDYVAQRMSGAERPQ